MNTITSILRFYIDGFKSMTIGKVLWTIILIKLFIMFVLLKLFFFPDFLGKFEKDECKIDYVSTELVNRAINP